MITPLLANPFEKGDVSARVDDVESGGHDTNWATASFTVAPLFQRAEMTRSVDADRESADDGDTGICKERAELMCVGQSVRSCGAGPDNRDSRRCECVEARSFGQEHSRGPGHVL